MSLTRMRMTKQRKLILEELRKVQDHPTAYEVYERVKDRLPQISLGTVYRNLEILSASGVITRLEMAHGQRRFDGNTDGHDHIRCVSCGRLDDIPLNTFYDMATIMGIVSEASGYEVFGCGMDFHGICPECQKQGKTAQSTRET
ncbi:MAG TPA: transcriptional repressor [Deltaproteobacteria bacterium]|nr:transcriptional repressor [Deltaproteobacteria bacterium]HPJ94511.1 transcriptional repressor [Deltaproteobacteria bacterium]